MRKTILLLLLLICCVGLYFFTKGNKTSTYDTSDREFTVENIDDLAKILIVPRNIPPTTLIKKNKEWFYNDTLVVREDVMINLLDVFKYMRIKYIPTSAAISNIKREMVQIGIKVNLYNSSDKLMKSFYVGGSPPDERGTYMMMDGADQPYTMEMPHMEGSVRGRFLLRPNEWRDRTLIKENVDQIVNVSIEYHKDQKQSFALDKENGVYYVSPLDNQVVGARKKADKNKTRAFLDGFEHVPGEYIENDNPYRDSISALLPFCTIEYTLDNGDHKKLSLHPVTDRLPDDTNLNQLKGVARINRFFANCSWGDFILVQQRQLTSIQIGYPYFIN